MMLRLSEGGDPAVGGQDLRIFTLGGATHVQAAIFSGNGQAKQSRLGKGTEIGLVGAVALVRYLGVGTQHRLRDPPGRLQNRGLIGIAFRAVGRKWRPDRVGTVLRWMRLAVRHAACSPFSTGLSSPYVSLPQLVPTVDRLCALGVECRIGTRGTQECLLAFHCHLSYRGASRPPVAAKPFSFWR